MVERRKGQQQSLKERWRTKAVEEEHLKYIFTVYRIGSMHLTPKTRSRRLVDAFGSTRRKRQLQTREGARVQADALGATEAVASLLKLAGDRAVASGATKAEVLGRAMGHRVLPPHDPEAINPQDAYK